MRLLIDAGNSRLKWNLCADDGDSLSQQTRALPWRDSDLSAELDSQWQDLQDIQSVWLSNVSGEALQQTLQHWLQQHWQLTPRIVRTQAAQLGVSNGYRDYTQLGVDRWLALLACRALLPGQDACIIDCGSAITVDMLTRDGKHLGGMILPGPELMLQSLLERTQAVDPEHRITTDSLPMPAHDETAPGMAAGQLFGQSTMECIGRGIAHSGIGFLQHIIRVTRQTVASDSRIVFTGGHAPQYLPHVSGDVLHYPDLVLKGLLLVAGEQI